jgi:hypothetical protein
VFGGWLVLGGLVMLAITPFTLLVRAPTLLACDVGRCVLESENVLGQQDERSFDAELVLGADASRRADQRGNVTWKVDIEVDAGWASELRQFATGEDRANRVERDVEAWVASGRAGPLRVEGPGPRLSWVALTGVAGLGALVYGVAILLGRAPRSSRAGVGRHPR